MADKCFCHLNGYAVKDATARKDISTLKERVNDLENKGTSGGIKLYCHELELQVTNNNAGINYEDTIYLTFITTLNGVLTLEDIYNLFDEYIVGFFNNSGMIYFENYNEDEKFFFLNISSYGDGAYLYTMNTTDGSYNCSSIIGVTDYVYELGVSTYGNRRRN